MENWEKFEIECSKYLNDKYGNDNINFATDGGHNANASDIKMTKNGRVILSIECKMAAAQCGQFVLFTDQEKRTFQFSQRNKTPRDKYVDTIIAEMEKVFDSCNKPSNNDLAIPESVIIDWVKNYYQNVKRSEFMITKGDDGFIVFPICNIDRYFSFSAKYRPKTSGSTHPSKSNIDDIHEALRTAGISAVVTHSDNECFIEYNIDAERLILQGEKYRYQLKKEESRYNIRQLSNTRNANFIVSISLKNPTQQEVDIKAFEHRILE